MMLNGMRRINGRPDAVAAATAAAAAAAAATAETDNKVLQSAARRQSTTIYGCWFLLAFVEWRTVRDTRKRKSTGRGTEGREQVFNFH